MTRVERAAPIAYAQARVAPQNVEALARNQNKAPARASNRTKQEWSPKVPASCNLHWRSLR